MTVPRTERWTKDGQTALVDVDDHERVLVTHGLLAQMLTDLGFTKERDRD